MKTFQVSTGDHHSNITPEQVAELDLIPAGPGVYHLLHDKVSYKVELLELDRDRKRVHLRLNGRDHHLSIRDGVDQLVDQLGFSAATGQQSKDVFAPMPGLVLDVMVTAGDQVTEGTPLLILEAMKMENVLKAEGEGTVTQVTITKGDAVDKRQLLIEIE